MKTRTILLGLGALAVEASLLALAQWQYHRMLEKEAMAAYEKNNPAITLQGTWMVSETVALDNQPNPAGEGIGWRLLTPLLTSESTVIVDRGWLPLPPDRTAPPDFTPFTPATGTVTGKRTPFPTRHGWLKGPDTTTHPRILAWLNPSLITSATTGTTYLQATTTSTSSTLLKALPPASPSGTNHASYALQWLVMALVFPILALWRLKRG